MKIFHCTITIIFLSFSLAVFGQKEVTKNGRVYVEHTVESKETLYAISRKYNVLQDTIVKYNPNALKGIKVGEILSFPVRNAEKPKTAKNTESVAHLVRPGETLYGIAKKYNAKVEDIVTANPSVANGLKSNELIYIPVRKEEKVKEEKPKDDSKLVTEDLYVAPKDQQKNNTEKYETVKVLNGDHCKNLKPTTNVLNIALLLPFNTSSTLNSKIAVEFYNGLLLSLDTIIKQGANIKIYTFDTNADKNVEEVLEKPVMKSMHLIVGPLYASKLNEAIRFANENKIPLITPFVRNDEVVQNNPYVLKLGNSDKNMASKTVRFFKSNYPNANFIVLKQRKGQDSLLMQDYIEALNAQQVKYKLLSRSVSEVTNALVDAEKNVIIYSGSSELQVRDFITQFNKNLKKQPVSIVGTEDWLRFSNIEPDYYENLNLHVPVSNYFSGIDSLNVLLAKQYQSKYKTFATVYAYKGYQIGDYFVRALWKYNNEFCACIPSYTAEGLGHNWFKMVQKDAKSGFYNEKIQLYIFQNYEYSIRIY